MSTVCTIARSNCANIKDFKANAGVGNMSTSIVGSLISTKNPAQNLQKCQRNRAPRVQLLMMYRLRVQNPALDQCRPSHIPSLLFKFIDYLQEECKLGHGGRLGYIDAISEFFDFRKVNGASDGVLIKLSATELYIKRARKTVAKMMRLQWTQDLDVES